MEAMIKAKETLRGFRMDVVGDEPQEVKEVFDWYEENFQFVPNLAKVLSASPAAQAVEVVTNIAAKVMSNLTNQLAMTEVDEPVRPFAEGLFESEPVYR